MTNEEAIKYIALIRKSEHIDIIKKDDALSKAMDALEKQMPKKPVGPKILIEGGGAKCPTCGKAFCTEYWKTKHCCICGQALDWSYNDDK